MNLFKSKTKDLRQVKCETCKHYIDLKDAQLVLVQSKNFFVITYSGYSARTLIDTFYCPMHRCDYDRIDLDGRKFKLIPAVAEHYEQIKEKSK